jgi:hypothetical protein
MSVDSTSATNYSPWQVVTMDSPSANTYTLKLTLIENVSAVAHALLLGVQISPNANVHIEFSTNLIDWQPLTSFTGPVTNVLFQNGVSSNTGRCFYRAVIP